MKTTLLAAAVAACFATAAMAQQPAQPGQQPSAQQPAQPGQQPSAQQPRQQPSPSTTQTAPAPHGADRTDQVAFQTADKNKDGMVNKEEAGQIAGFDFTRADTNNNNSLTRQEFEVAMTTSTPRGDGVQGSQSGDRTVQVSFETADGNRDGKIDRDEAGKINGFNFSSADVDDNKSLTRQEFQSAMATSQPRG